MIAKLEITPVHTSADERLGKYVNKKIGQLDRYLPRRMRPSLHAEVWLKESKAKDKDRYTCEVTLHVPQQILNTKESALNMYAAIDIVETKLKHQLKKYKDLHSSPKIYRRVYNRLRRRTA